MSFFSFGDKDNWLRQAGRWTDSNVLQNPAVAAGSLAIPGLGLGAAAGLGAYQLFRKKGDSSQTTPAPSQDPNANDPQAAQTKKIQDELQNFYQEMSKPVDLNDPYAKSIMDMSGSAIQKQMAANGITGNGSLAAQQRGMQDSLNQYQLQRQGMAQQALSTGGQVGLGLMQEQRARSENAYGAAQNAYNQGMQSAGGMGSLIGTAAGGIIGGGLAAATGGAAAPMIPGLIQAGSSVGGAVGTQNYRQSAAAPKYYGGGG